ncbi:MAG: hypothetical protein M3032_06215 [Verrucomicrobiota bacterium]|nr:hypothetical protein [Verrucomicrobiota bacterium]
MKVRVGSAGIAFAFHEAMVGMHNFTKNEREAVRQLVHKILTRDMASFNPESFQTWVKQLDEQFRKVAMTMRIELHSRAVHVSVKELRSGRVVFKFVCSSHVRFPDDAVSLAQAPVVPAFR